MEAAGDLGSLTRFLYDVEQGPMALELESVNIKHRDKKQASNLRSACKLMGWPSTEIK